MKILGIESASLTASAALIEDGNLLSEFTTNYKKTHSETLLPMIDAVLSAAGTDISEVDAIAVSEGPGSFTGLRIGVSTAKGLAFAADKPIVSVPTLDAIAYGVYESGCVLSPLLDARREETYTGLYSFENGLFTVHESANACSVTEQVKKAENLAKMLQKPVLYLGDGLPVFRETIERISETKPHFAPAHTVTARASSVAALGLLKFHRGETVSAFTVEPVYLRKSQAERERDGHMLKDFTLDYQKS